MAGSLGLPVPMRLCSHGGPLGTLHPGEALPTASPARMCARRGNLFPPPITFFFQLKKLLFREVKGLL